MCSSDLKTEIQRVRDTTQFNGQNLLDGSFGPRAYTLVNDEYNASVSTADFEGIKINGATITGLVVDSVGVREEDGTLRLDASSLNLDDFKVYDGDPTSVTDPEERNSMEYFEGPYESEVHGDLVKITDSTGKMITLQIDQEMGGSEKIMVDFPYTGSDEDRTRYGMTAQVGSNEGSFLNPVIPDVSLNSLGIRFVDASTPEGARNSIEDIKDGLTKLARIRSDLGAVENQLEHTVSYLNVSEENATDSYSTLMDTDMAEEMVQYSTYQILTQTGTSMLAQANQRAADMLQLIQ